MEERRGGGLPRTSKSSISPCGAASARNWFPPDDQFHVREREGRAAVLRVCANRSCTSDAAARDFSGRTGAGGFRGLARRNGPPRRRGARRIRRSASAMTPSSFLAVTTARNFSGYGVAPQGRGAAHLPYLDGRRAARALHAALAGQVPRGGVTNEIVHITDLSHALARMTGAPLPADRPIDGVDQLDFFLAPGAVEPRRLRLLHQAGTARGQVAQLENAHRVGARSEHERPIRLETPYLFNLRDPKEETDLNVTGAGWARSRSENDSRFFRQSESGSANSAGRARVTTSAPRSFLRRLINESYLYATARIVLYVDRLRGDSSSLACQADQSSFPFRPAGRPIPLFSVADPFAAPRRAGDCRNKPGAAGSIGFEFVARSAPDGYTLVVGNDSLGLQPHLEVRLGHDPLKDFAGVVQLSDQPLVIAAHASFASRRCATSSIMAGARIPALPAHVTVGHRQFAASDRRMVFARRRHRDGARTLQGRRAGDHRFRPDRCRSRCSASRP